MFKTIVISLIDTKLSINIAVCYKSPSESNKEFIEHLDQLFNKYKNIILVGDTNIDLFSETDVSTMYMDMLDVSHQVTWHGCAINYASN